VTAVQVMMSIEPARNEAIVRHLGYDPRMGRLD